MSDPTQNPPPDQGGSHPPPPPDSPEGQAPPPPPAAPAGPTPGQGEHGTTPPGQGSYGTTPPPPPPQGGWQQPGTMPPPVQATGGIGQPADLLPRFVARLVDFILVGFVQFFLGVLVLVVLGITNQDAWTGGLWMSNGVSWAANALSSVIGAALFLGYFTIMESRRGQTLGKMIMKLETRGPGGGHPTTEQALKRNAFTAIGVLGVIPFLGAVAGLLSLAAFIMIAVTISQDTVTRHGWHDNFAGGTTVIRIG
jgi:uncharacterized RDD family membrane protein YckC